MRDICKRCNMAVRLAGKRSRLMDSLCPETLLRPSLRSDQHLAPTTYRKLLLEVAYKLSPLDVQELRFLLKDAVPPPALEEAVTRLRLLESLERYKLLGPDDYTSLEKYLREIGREDLAALLTPKDDTIQSCPVPKGTPESNSVVPFNASRHKTKQWGFSTFRALSLQVFMELGRDEVEQIRWLSMDFCRPKTADETSNIDLMQAMEENNLIGPGNYSFLVDCLHEIGRQDLAGRILPPSLPRLPHSLDMAVLLNRKRLEMLQSRKTQYQFGMRHLAVLRQNALENTRQMAGGWHKRILASVARMSVEPHSSYIIENLPETLINTSLYINSLLDGVEEYECNGDTRKFAHHMSECKIYLDRLQSMMEEIDWESVTRKRENLATSKQYHPVRRASYGAFSGLAEFLLEFTTRQEGFQEQARFLSKTLTRLESILYLSGFMWSLTSWLVALLQVALRSPVCLNKYKDLFRILVLRNRGVIQDNRDIMEEVLRQSRVGRALLKSFKEKKLLVNDTALPAKAASPHSVLFHRSVTPVLVFVFVLLLLCEYPSLSAVDVEIILASLKSHVEKMEEGFSEINTAVTVMVLEGIYRNIECFRRSKLKDFNVEGYTVNELFTY